MDLEARRPSGPDQLVSRIRYQRCPGVADQGDRILAELCNDPPTLSLAAVVVVAAHRRLRADVGEQLGRYPRVLGENSVDIAQRVRRARAEVAKIADRGCDNVQPR